MNKLKKGLMILPAFLLVISGCVTNEDNPVESDDTVPQDTEDDSEKKGDDEGSGSTETTYDAAYALYGDFADSSWKESPSTDSIYYLPYSTSDKSTMYWERTVTIDSASQNWDAGFRVIEYGSWSNTVVSYSDITSDSTGVRGPGNDNNIIVTWGETYDLVIDCTGTSNKITVTLVEEEIEVNIDSYYVISGDIDGYSWKDSPGYTNDLTLPYDSSLANSKYWQRTITTCSAISEQDNPGFRLLNYGSWENTIGYSNFSSISGSGVCSWTDNDNNFKLLNYSASYDVTIDMRGSSWSIIIDTHTDGFEKVDGKYDDTSSGGSSSGGSSSSGSGSWVSGSAFTGASVDKIDAIASNDDYIMGADMSSIVEVLSAGGVFYDYSGNAIADIDDFMKFMADQGINYARIRLWNNPYNSSTNASYGGGGNDLNTDLEIAKAASKAGMKICLDFHYSDFWADRERQFAPSAWSNYSGTALTDAAAKFTTETLEAFKDVGCTPSMVQVGNETNNNSICGTSGTSFFSACCSAVRSFATTNNTDIKIVIHHSDDQDVNTISGYITALTNANVDFDIIGLSFYPFWHKNGNISTLQSDMQTLKSKFSGKDVCLMEYSYGWTTDYTSWGTQYGNMSNTFNDSLASVAGYEATPQGQASAVHDINEAVVNGGGIGSFYWEPAWISKQGTSWASSASEEFYTSHGVSTSGWSFDTTSWANQAFFDYDGYALQSLKVFDQMKNGVDYSDETYVSGNLDLTASVYAYSDRASQLPQTTDIYTNTGSIVPCDITWNETDIATLESAVGGSTVTVKGTITFNGTTQEVSATVTIINEYIRNGGFEEGSTDRDAFCEGWTFTGTGGRVRNTSGDARSGSFYYDPWLANAFTCGIYQEIGTLAAGKYSLETYYQITSSDDIDISITLYVKVGETTKSMTLSDKVSGQYVYASLDFELTSSEAVTIGLDVVGAANACAYIDDFSMQYV